MYLVTRKRPDIAVAVARLSLNLETPGHNNWQAALKVLCYHKVTKDVGIVFTGNNRDELISVFATLMGAAIATIECRYLAYFLYCTMHLLLGDLPYQKSVALIYTEEKYYALCKCINKMFACVFS